MAPISKVKVLHRVKISEGRWRVVYRRYKNDDPSCEKELIS